MANQYINIYQGDPTAGETDGVLVGSGDEDNPIAVTLNASQNEVKTIKLAVRCNNGFQTYGDTVIRDMNDANDRWKFALLENGDFSDEITINSVIDTVNTIFYGRASSDSLEGQKVDTNVKFVLSTTVFNV